MRLSGMAARERDTKPRQRTGGQVLVDQLAVHGVQHAFCVPGESYLAVLDALHDAAIALTVCRQEGGAAMMAEAQGKLTGNPGICFVTRGPGALNASPGLHIARQDSTPMILFVGQVAREMREREAFQELDYRAVFGSIAKWATEIDDAARIPEIVSRAFHVATSGRPGPVVIALPEDMLSDLVTVSDAAPFSHTDSHPSPSQIAELEHLLADAKAPIAVVGGSRWTLEAVAGFERFAQRFALPVVCSFRRQMLFAASHDCYAGDMGPGPNPKLVERMKKSDLVLLIGGRFSEMPSQGYSLLDIPLPHQRLVHVHPDTSELNRVYKADLAVAASPSAFVEALVELTASPSAQRIKHRDGARADYLSWSDGGKTKAPGPMQMSGVIDTLQQVLPETAIVCNGAGNYAIWVHRFWRFSQFGTQLAPTSGSMGYGVPAAIGAKRLFPERAVLAFAGDGCFLMNGQEFATAVQYELPILVIVVDNGMYGTIRMHQEREYPGRVSGTSLSNPDFAAYAEAFGGHGERVETTEDFAPALERALASGKPAIIHCLVDPEAITPSASLSEIRNKAMAQG